MRQVLLLQCKKLKLKEDEGGNKISEVRGIRAGCKVMKTRYAKPFEGVQVKIPYETGMNPYSGLIELFEKKGLLEKQGNRLKYVDLKGEEHLDYRKAWMEPEKMDMIMSEYNEKTAPVVNTQDDEPVEEAVELVTNEQE
tara:strand:+ start:344 stop:760 length:417 start_codon:yes stop_codon:yes gene_type:complete